jgi:hypothetical protein
MLRPQFVIGAKLEGIHSHNLGFEWNSWIQIEGIHVINADLIEIKDRQIQVSRRGEALTIDKPRSWQHLPIAPSVS